MEISGFNSLEELQKRFPIGTVVEWAEPRTYSAFYYTEKDLQLLRKQDAFDSIKIIGSNMIEVTTKRQPNRTITGYIFDGEKWWPAYETWDGWVEWREED